MRAMAVHQGRHRRHADHVQAAADQREAVAREIDHLRQITLRVANQGFTV